MMPTILKTETRQEVALDDATNTQELNMNTHEEVSLDDAKKLKPNAHEELALDDGKKAEAEHT